MAPFRIARPRFLAYFAVELGLVLLVLYGLASLTLTLAPSQQIPEEAYLSSIALIGVLFFTVLFGTQWANLGDHGSFRREIVLFSFLSALLGLAGFAALWFMAPDDRLLPALLVLEGGFAVPLAVAGWRWLSRRFDLLNATRETLVIVGTGENACRACRWIVTQHSREYGIAGFAADDESRMGSILSMGVRIQTDYRRLVSFCLQRADRVLVALDEKRGQLPVRQLMELRLHGIEIEEATSFFERIGGKISVETMLPSWLIFSEGFKNTALRALLKRVADITLSVGLLVLTAPLALLTALLIRMDSPGGVIFRQERLGRDGEPFELLKFRSMKQSAERESGPAWAIENDPRITRVGRVIRKLRIDELPQLINVLRGEMSFVGPRPEREHFVRQLEQRIPYYGLRMTARPGITGWAQVEYGYGSTEEESMEKLKYDLYYIKNSNLLLDLWIVLKTVKVVLFGQGR